MYPEFKGAFESAQMQLPSFVSASVGHPVKSALVQLAFNRSMHSRAIHVRADYSRGYQNQMTGPTKGKDLRILIVDDDDALRHWLRVQLEPRGFEVWEESQGDEGLAAYDHNGPWSFVLSDMYFYRGERIRNGLELVRAIAAINPDQRMAIHTSEKSLEAPVPVLAKPYPIGRLLRLLRWPLPSFRGSSELAAAKKTDGDQL